MVLIIELAYSAFLLMTSIAPLLYTSLLLHKHGLSKSYRTINHSDSVIFQPPSISSSASSSPPANLLKNAVDISATSGRSAIKVSESPATASATETLTSSPAPTGEDATLDSICCSSDPVQASAATPSANETDLLHPADSPVDQPIATANTANLDTTISMIPYPDEATIVDNGFTNSTASLSTLSNVSPLHPILSYRAVFAFLVMLALILFRKPLARRLRSPVDKKKGEAVDKAPLRYRRALVKPSTTSHQLLLQPTQPGHGQGLDAFQSLGFNGEPMRSRQLQYRPYFQSSVRTNPSLTKEADQPLAWRGSEENPQEAQGAGVDSDSVYMSTYGPDSNSTSEEGYVGLTAIDSRDRLRLASDSEVGSLSPQVEETLQNKRYIPPHKRRRNFHEQTHVPRGDRKRDCERNQTVLIRDSLGSLEPSNEPARPKASDGINDDGVANWRARKAAVAGPSKEKEARTLAAPDEQKKTITKMSESESSVMNWRRLLVS